MKLPRIKIWKTPLPTLPNLCREIFIIVELTRWYRHIINLLKHRQEAMQFRTCAIGMSHQHTKEGCAQVWLTWTTISSSCSQLTYRQALKRLKSTTKATHNWSSDSNNYLRGCFECTDWNVLKDPVDLIYSIVTVWLIFSFQMLRWPSCASVQEASVP